jgi:MYXO-CTERM domain-containing protein
VVPPTNERLGLRHAFCALTIGVLSFATPSVQASETERPATWDMSLEELQSIGLGQSRGEPVPVPFDAFMGRDPNGPVYVKQGVVFVNFDGAQLTAGPDNSKTNTTQISQMAGTFAAYGQGAKREAVMQATRENFAAYNIIVTDTRPASGDYVMNMTGPTNPFGGGVLGIAPLDCNDAQTHNNITYAFHSVNDSFSAAVTATTIGQEVAHSFGLEHVNEPGDIMNPYNAGGNASFIDQCITIAPSQNGIVCGAQHAAQCGQTTLQNSHRELLALFGPNEPDTQAPTVQITSPNDGDGFGVGADFEIQVSANDDTGIQILYLFNHGQQIESDTSEPYGWSVVGAPEGTYEFHVEAHDLAGNVGVSNTVTVTVSDVPQGNTSGSGGGGGSDGDSGDSGGGGSPDGDGGDASGGGDDGFDAEDEDALPGGFGHGGAGDGCSCRTDLVSGRGRAAAWMGLLALALVRRRRRRS